MMHTLEKQLLEAKAERRILSGEVICVPQTTQEQKFVHFQLVLWHFTDLCFEKHAQNIITQHMTVLCNMSAHTSK